MGLPRAGSTLIEQILASHSQVEGTMELPGITAMARSLGERIEGEETYRYLTALAALRPDELAAFGEAYLCRTRAHRKTARPRFVDKMPNNFNFVGLIHSVLPNARR